MAGDEHEPAARRPGGTGRIDGRPPRWFVSVSLPIEADSPGEAVQEFWTYVDKLGPRQLPAHVWPQDDELAMQTYVLDHEANQDPEDE